jgi:arabinosaccharide transport system permease protein
MFKPGQELMRYGISLKLDVTIMSFSNYLLLATDNRAIHFRWYANSLIIIVIQTAICLNLSSAVGYVSAVYQFRGWEVGTHLSGP